MSYEKNSDESFLGYVELHSRTDLALFSRPQVLRFLALARVDLAGYNIPPEKGFVSMKSYSISEEMARARRQVQRNKGGYQLELPFSEDGAGPWLLEEYIP